MIRAAVLLLTAVAVLAVTASGQQGSLTFTGQMWGSGAYGDDPLEEFGNSEATAGYIPQLSLGTGRHDGLRLEGLIALRAAYLYRLRLSIRRWEMAGAGHVYRGWMQLRSTRWDLRLGRQKIAFGPGQFLRPLAWFDTLDLRDPTGQTQGVNAVRARFFPNDRLSVWGWGMVQNDSGPGSNRQDFSPGGRMEYLLGDVEVGLSFHQENFSGQSTSRTRLAFDMRADKIVGLWTEGLIMRETGPQADLGATRMLMVGVDYTLPIGNGMLVMAEHLQSRVVFATGGTAARTQATVVLGALPLGLFDRLTAVAYFSHDTNFSSYFLMWQRTYDFWSLSTLVFANPPRSQLGALGNIFPSVVGVGTSVQLLLVFHH
ncbi:MAG: hypothetical protein IID15_05780 [Candidatus Marinimicrobia bacterium]|nr:hypothetical protein [Candidatus Neomarinimicrobiota bacterium]